MEARAAGAIVRDRPTLPVTGQPRSEDGHGALDVERGHPVRPRHHSGQALHRDRLEVDDQLQPAPREGPQPDQHEDLVPRGGGGHPPHRDGPRLRVGAGPVRGDRGRGPRERAPGHGAVHRDPPVRAARRQQREPHPVRQAGLLHRAGPDRAQGVRAAQARAHGQGPHGDLQDRAPRPGAPRRARPVRQDDAPLDDPLARRDQVARASSTCPTRSPSSAPPSARWPSSWSRR